MAVDCFLIVIISVIIVVRKSKYLHKLLFHDICVVYADSILCEAIITGTTRTGEVHELLGKQEKEDDSR